MGTAPPQPPARTWVSAIVATLLGLAVGAAGGKALLLLYFTFWFITMGLTVLVLGLLFWMMVLSSRLRWFAIRSIRNIVLFHVGMVLGLFLVGA